MLNMNMNMLYIDLLFKRLLTQNQENKFKPGNGIEAFKISLMKIWYWGTIKGKSIKRELWKRNEVSGILTKGLFFLFLDRTIAEIPAMIAYKSQHGEQSSNNRKVRLACFNTGTHKCHVSTQRQTKQIHLNISCSISQYVFFYVRSFWVQLKLVQY